MQRVSSGGEVVDADLSLLQSFAASPTAGAAPLAAWPPARALPPLLEEPAATESVARGRAAGNVSASRRPTAGTLGVVVPARRERAALGPEAVCRQAFASLHADDAAPAAAARCVGSGAA